MKPCIVLHVDSLRRDFVALVNLKLELETSGYKVLLTSRSSTSKLLAYFTPSILILSHPFTLSVEELNSLRIRKTKIYILEVEGILNHENGIASTYPDYLDYDLFEGLFVWNKWSKNWLIANRKINSNKIYVTGSLRNHGLSMIVQNNKERIIGILSRFELINTFDSRHFFENLLTLDPEDENNRWYFERISIDSEVFSIISNLIYRLIGKGYKVSVRPHPNENIDAYRLLQKKFGKLLEIDKSYDILSWLNKLSVIVGPVSTAYTEAYLLGIPIISTEKIQRFHLNEVSESARLLKNFSLSAYMPTNIEEAFQLCQDSNLAGVYSEEFNEFLEAFYAKDSCPDNMSRVVEVIKNTIGKNNEKIYRRQNYGIYIKHIIDLYWLIRLLFSSNPIKAFKNNKNYNYNIFLHKS